jgi:hypothetical protein
VGPLKNPISHRGAMGLRGRAERNLKEKRKTTPHRRKEHSMMQSPKRRQGNQRRRITNGFNKKPNDKASIDRTNQGEKGDIDD